jgi:hypothetical protein
MIQDPYIGHIHSLMEGLNCNKVQTFYKNHFFYKKMPSDIKIKPISRTAG